MSFPLNIQPLVIEDDEGAKDAYKDIFDTSTLWMDVSKAK
jgi:hypothetical protein